MLKNKPVSLFFILHYCLCTRCARGSNRCAVAPLALFSLSHLLATSCQSLLLSIEPPLACACACAEEGYKLHTSRRHMAILTGTLLWLIIVVWLCCGGLGVGPGAVKKLQDTRGY